MSKKTISLARFPRARALGGNGECARTRIHTGGSRGDPMLPERPSEIF